MTVTTARLTKAASLAAAAAGVALLGHARRVTTCPGPWVVANAVPLVSGPAPPAEP